jgi:excisionase family DNA binding protein
MLFRSWTMTNRASRNGNDRVVPKMLLTYDEAAWSVGVCRRTFQDWVAEYEIPHIHIGGKVFFRPEDLRDFVDSCPLNSG